MVKKADRIIVSGYGAITMDTNVSMRGPVNFFMGGGRYISDNFNMQIIDTSNPNAFENLTLNSVMPDMLESYIHSEKNLTQNTVQEENNNGIWEEIKKFFSPQ